MKTLIILILSVLSTAFVVTADFLADQKKHERVKEAYGEKKSLIAKQLKDLDLNLDNINLLITVFKEEQELTLYVKKKTDIKYKKLSTYQICANSGELGPKRKQGDGQVPEGFYSIDRFNPASSYYLSLGVNYPNQSDKIKSKAADLGGDIFIHGECVTIGCMPMTNDKIKEIYIYAIQARDNGQLKIPVYIFPFKFTDENIAKYTEQYKANAGLIQFWDNLKPGYDKFHTSFQELKMKVDKNGNYQLEAQRGSPVKFE